MKKLLVIILILLHKSSMCQNWDNEVICSDTTFVYSDLATMECSRKMAFSLRYEFGRAQFYYGKKTADWIGNHGGLSFGVYGGINQITFGIRGRGWDVIPHKELDFDDVLLTSDAELNHVKTDFYLGYSLDYKYNFSLEPGIGYSRLFFSVGNEEELNQEYNIPNGNALFIGVTLNKYIEFTKNGYIAIFSSFNYGFTDYSKIHPELSGGYIDWTVGVAFKGAPDRKFLRIFRP